MPAPDWGSPALVHDLLIAPLVDTMFKPMTDADGNVADVLAVLETVAASVLAIAVKPDGDDKALAIFAANVAHRLALVRLDNAPPAGSA